MTIEEILRKAVSEGASDILIIAGMPAGFKINGLIQRQGERLLPDAIETLVKDLYHMAGERDMSPLLNHGDDDFSFAVSGLCRFRVNALKQRGSLGLVIRVVSFTLPDRNALGIPDNVMAFAKCTRGMVLLTGPAGSGKTTTLACIVDEINSTRNSHIITIEDPIEYLHHHKMSVVTQRELSTDTVSYDTALRAALREAPDIILLGEMRDADTIRAAVTAAETGHLVISTLHTVGASSTIDRIVDSFPPEQQQQIRTQLAMVLEGVVSQQLIPTVDGKLVPAFEVMSVNSAIRNMIRESKAHQIDNVISQSAAEGMVTMDQSLVRLVQSRRITAEEAQRHSVNSEWMSRRLSVGT